MAGGGGGFAPGVKVAGGGGGGFGPGVKVAGAGAKVTPGVAAGAGTGAVGVWKEAALGAGTGAVGVWKLAALGVGTGAKGFAGAEKPNTEGAGVGAALKPLAKVLVLNQAKGAG